MTSEQFENAVVVLANTAQLGPGQRIEFGRVESRMLLWCKAGCGTVTANGQRCVFEPGRYLVLPWAHHIIYQADSADPFLLAGIHVVPRHDRCRKVVLGVAHRPNDPLSNVTWRGDVEIPSLRTVKQGELEPAAPLTHLAEYILALFMESAPPDWLARRVAGLLLHELSMAVKHRKAYAHNAPLELQRMMQYARANLHRPLSLSDLVSFAKLSPATVGRMFRRHLHTTPVTWLLEQRMQRACVLLRTRRLSVAEVGERVGIPDAYYFSKRFRKQNGQSPREYQRSQRWM